MNIAKKLLFGLLLGGALFATACGDSNEGKAQKGQKCTAEKKCDTNLLCDATSDGAAEGLCKEKYDQTKCANGTSEPAKKLQGEQDSPGNYCKEGSTQPVKKIAVGQPCDAAGSLCVDGAECVKVEASAGKTCEKTCDSDSDDHADCKAADSAKAKCKAANDPSTTFICKA